ncbi:hypothetical protein N7462_006035 [Penicillium macrosclerotiorum]|uniref:uncharacterized protein n=1 Tax=Penicillium macrosclerotiorum TaxID=303699 RepID=UPI00254850EB|nr:uncharacterized protein N7462_006035 [Penicillium macrosclerotiorum]KAJ5682870.1 hypothetical protein N7462_006035 [Penicillium macrosclerotiorum]
MRLQSTGAAWLLSALVPSLTTALSLDCAHINVDKYKYDLSPLGGVHEIYHVNETDGFVTNTTYVLNICNNLHKAANRGDDGKCGQTKRICGFVNRHPVDGNGATRFGFPIVGLDDMGHGSMEPELTRLAKLDPETEGLRIKLAGGEFAGDDNEAKPKKAGAIIDFQCDPDRSGLEGLVTEEDSSDVDEKKRRDEGDEKTQKRSLQFKSFKLDDDDTYILKLDWRTRYACDDYQRGKINNSNHWGFFTWMIIILFLCVAAYLIFGSWLNYNRYGARGWDLLPHGDTIRDVPYIFQDWFRRVVNTLQGSGTRGGYSAV